MLEFDPPTHVALSWHLNHEFVYVADSARASRIDITFVVEGPSTTRVDLVHSQLERRGDQWEGVRNGVRRRGVGSGF